MNRAVVFTLLFVFLSLSSLATDFYPSVSKGKVERVSPFDSQLIESRFLDVWLPPGYSQEQKYDVLYMHDARMLFDAKITWNQQEWMVDEVAGTLIEQNKVRPFIVVAIPNAGAKRHSEFFPQKPFESLIEQAQASLYQRERSPGDLLFKSRVYSDNYLKFIVTEVVPYIEMHYSVNKGGKHRYLAGSSMGGLISWYGLMEYPNEFAGAISMSTHWPGTFETDKVAFKAFLSYIENQLPSLTTHKIYFDHGDQTLDVMYPQLQKQINNLFEQQKYPDKQWHSQFFPGEDHSEKSWSKRLNIPFEFMFAPQ